MHRIAAVSASDRDHRGYIEVSGGAPAGDQHRIVASAHMQACGIVVRIDAATCNSGFCGGARDADGDLAAIGNEKLLQFRSSV
jgi:hypothetical protein